MKEAFLIKLKLQDDSYGYIHFNPYTKQYFTGETKLGACGFDLKNADEFVSDNNISDYEFEKLCLNSNIKQVKTNKNSKEEKEVFDKTH
jgi:hypothetical protein